MENNQYFKIKIIILTIYFIFEIVGLPLIFFFPPRDFLFTKDGLVLNEIENVVGARMVYSKTNINVAKLLIEYICANLNTKQ